MDSSSKSCRAVVAAARQRGYSLLEMSLAIGAIAIIAVIAFLAFSDTQTGINQTRALNEINAVVSSAQRYRAAFARGGLYTGINMGTLVDNGYPIGGMQVIGSAAASKATNTYGLDVTIAVAAAGADATLVYNVASNEECETLEAVFTDGTDFVNGFKAPSSCGTGGSANILTLTID